MRDKTRAIICGDVHLSDTAPSVRTDTYTQDMLDKLEHVVRIANGMPKIDCLIQLGDMFDKPVPHRTSHALVQAAANILSKSKVPVFILAGNHDLRWDRLDSLDRQPLGTLFLLPNVHPLHGYNKEFNICGVPYLDDPDDWNNYLSLEIKEDTLVCFHASIFPRSEMPPFECIAAEDLAPLVPSQFIAYGHIHNIPKKGAYYKVGDTWFCNRGAISRGSLHGEDLSRIPGVTLFDSHDLHKPFRSIDLPHKPVEEVFQLEKHYAAVDAKERVESFLQGIGDIAVSELSQEAIKTHVLETLGVQNHKLVDEIWEIL